MGNELNSIEFGKKCRPLNIEYGKLFGHIPCFRDFKCSQEEYFEALSRAVKEEREIGEYISKAC